METSHHRSRAGRYPELSPGPLCYPGSGTCSSRVNYQRILVRLRVRAQGPRVDAGLRSGHGSDVTGSSLGLFGVAIYMYAVKKTGLCWLTYSSTTLRQHVRTTIFDSPTVHNNATFNRSTKLRSPSGLRQQICAGHAPISDHFETSSEKG